MLESYATDSNKMSALADETWDYMYGGAEPTTTVAVEGCVGALEPEVEAYMKQYLVEVWGYTEDELAEANILMIQQPASMSTMVSLFWIGVALTVVAIIWFVINMIRYAKREKAV